MGPLSDVQNIEVNDEAQLLSWKKKKRANSNSNSKSARADQLERKRRKETDETSNSPVVSMR